MKPNRVRELLAQGKTPIGHMIMEFGTRGIAKIVEAAGVDFVLIDGEHSGFDMGQIDDMLKKSFYHYPVCRRIFFTGHHHRKLLHEKF